MLKTALKPQWIGVLLLALVVSTVFVLLSQWQFSRSIQTAEQPSVSTETPQALTDTLQPGEGMTAIQADQVVTVKGQYDPGKQVVVKERIRDNVTGYWVVTAFTVDGVSQAGEKVVIPVARGWISDPGHADAPPTEPQELTGRLLPAEAPILEKDLPPGQVAALATAELINLWDTPSYQGFIISFAEPTGSLQNITVGPQPQEQKVNWLNIFYAVEWVIFAGFAFFLWWRLVADDYRREQEELEDSAESDEAATDPSETSNREETSKQEKA